MRERRGFRFALEVVFLAALAAVLSFTNLRPVVVAGLMLLGWLIVTLLEWATSRGTVPVGLPAPSAAEPAWHGYPAAEHHDDALTRVAWPALRAEAVGGWPVAVPAHEHEPAVVAQPEFDPIQLLASHAELAERELEPAGAVQVVTATRLERHRIDPLRDLDRNRLPWRRGGEDESDVVTIPVRPDGLRILPLRLQRED